MGAYRPLGTLFLFDEISDADRSCSYVVKNSMYVKIRYGIVMIPLRE